MANGKVGAPSGNKNGVKQNRVWADAIRKCIAQGKRLDKLAAKLVDLAEAGDLQALKEIGDRLDGKAAQQIVGSEPDGGHKLVVEVIRFADQDSQ